MDVVVNKRQRKKRYKSKLRNSKTVSELFSAYYGDWIMEQLMKPSGFLGSLSKESSWTGSTIAIPCKRGVVIEGWY